MTDDRRNPAQPDRRLAPRRGGRREADPPADYVSVPTFAAKYGIHPDTVHKWLKADLLVSYRVGPLIRIRDLPPNCHSELKRAETLNNPLPPQ